MFGTKKALQCIRREYQEKLRMIQEAHKAEYKAMNAMHQEELERLDKKYNALDEKLKALETLKEAQKAEIKALEEEHREKFQQMQILRKEASFLKETCEALQADNDRVYAGHRGLEAEIQFLKYRAQTLDELHA